MANCHYANIGDVWKHLSLTQILHAEQPLHYWESHAGDAVYTYASSAAREYGIEHFLQTAPQTPMLKDTVYFRLAERYMGNEPPLYSGSSALALSLLGGSETGFLFCDVDSDSILNIGMMGSRLGVPRERLRLVHGEGLATLSRAVGQATDETLAETVAFLDPYNALSHSDEAPSTLALFCELALVGVQTILWYGYETDQEQQTFHSALATQLKAALMDPVTHNLWIGEMRLGAVQGFYNDFHPGVLGCGLLCANLSQGTITLCIQLGEALKESYAGVKLPDGQPGDLYFTHAAFGAS